MTRVAAALVAIVWIALCAGAASAGPAPNPEGDWTGTLHVTGRGMELGIRVHQTPRGYVGTYEAVKQEVRNIPLTPLHSAAGPAFEVKSPYGTFAARWDQQAGVWRAEWRTKGKVYPFTMRRGYIPPAPLVSKPDRIALIVLAVVSVLEAVAIARLLQLRRRRRLEAVSPPRR